MAQQRPHRGRVARTSHGVRRIWPFVLMAWERWQSLTPQERERYRRHARDYADRGKRVLQSRRRGRPRR